MNRRTLFGAIAAVASAGAFAAFPLHALAYPGPRDGPTPDVYLARCIIINGLEHETWLHTTNPTWAWVEMYKPDDIPAYKDRHATMAERYARERWHG